MTLEADGIIDVWEIETGKVVAQYEGLEVHEDMQSIPDMKQRIAELEQTVLRQMETIARLEQDNRRLQWLDTIPMFAIENIARETQLASWDAWKEINEWLDSRDGAA